MIDWGFSILFVKKVYEVLKKDDKINCRLYLSLSVSYFLKRTISIRNYLKLTSQPLYSNGTGTPSELSGTN